MTLLSEAQTGEPYIGTYTGKRLHFLNPSPDEITIVDIAHHLSLINRFTGATKYPFSVAQHSINVATWVQSNGGTAKEIKQALLHDAPEAYVNDLSSPIKHAEGLAGYRLIEYDIWVVMAHKYGVAVEKSDLLKEADDIAGHTEALELMTYRPEWASPSKRSVTMAMHKRPWEDVQASFLDYFLRLS